MRDPGAEPRTASYQSALRRQTPKVGAGCSNWARPDPCGGCPAMGIPTAILGHHRPCDAVLRSGVARHGPRGRRLQPAGAGGATLWGEPIAHQAVTTIRSSVGEAMKRPSQATAGAGSAGRTIRNRRAGKRFWHPPRAASPPAGPPRAFRAERSAVHAVVRSSLPPVIPDGAQPVSPLGRGQ